MIRKDILMFLLGTVVGAALTAVYFNNKEAKMLEEEAEWCENVARGNRRDVIKVDECMDEVEYETEKKILVMNKDRYKKIARVYNTEVRAELESPPEDIGEPHVITFEQFNEECDNYDKITLTYYADGDTLTDEDESIIDNVLELVGYEALLSFGEGSNDPDIVYVRNDSLRIDYEIVRSEGSYKTIVLGIIEET